MKSKALHHSELGQMSKVLNFCDAVALKPYTLEVEVLLEALNSLESYKIIGNYNILPL